MQQEAVNTSFLSVFPISFSKTGNIASVGGVLDLVTYLGSGVSAFIYGIAIEKMGYSIMFVSWIVISIVSLMILGNKTLRENIT